jgi:hypothetical protein
VLWSIELLFKYERITWTVTRTTAQFFQIGSRTRTRSGTVVEMRTQLVNRGKPHHPLGHLRLDRSVGIQGVSHSVDDARLEHGYRRLSLVSAGWLFSPRCVHATFAECRRCAPGTPLQSRLGGPRAFRFWPCILESRGRRLACWRNGRCHRRGGMDIDCGWIGIARFGAFALPPRA